MTGNRFRLVLVITVAALVLGIGTTAVLAAAGPDKPGRPFVSAPASCDPPVLPGAVVDVTLADMPGSMMGPGMMGPGWNGSYGPMMGRDRGGQYGGGAPGERYRWPGMRMMGVWTNPATVPAGQVSFVVRNAGAWIHELMVLPLGPGQYLGQRLIGADNRVDESTSLGEAAPCGRGDSHDIVSRATGWFTLTLAPGRYELICNIAGHYWAGMYTELTVTG
jgi:uncharacterized cupredoxin-like copper-binding protein